MPEMPEVETMVDRLQRWVGYNIVAADGRHERYLPDGENGLLIGQPIKGVYRRGKFIIFMLKDYALLCHNAMSGYWDSDDDRWTFDYVEGARESRDSDIRACLLVCPPGKVLAEHGRNLFFHDARKFGSLRVMDPAGLAAKLSGLGPEALESKHLYEPREVITLEQFRDAINASKPVKELLMDQSRIAGLGNIYAAEALWYARVSPHRLGNTLGEVQTSALFEECRNVMGAALARKLDYKGLVVYRRKTCGRCDPIRLIVAEKLKGRTTHWCPECQK